MRVNKIFKMMLDIPSNGIYCLINYSDKRVYIKFSRDISTSLSRVVKDVRSKNSIYKQLIRDRSKLEFLHLEDINHEDSDLDIHLKMDHHVKDFLAKGYSLYNSKYKLAKFKVAIEVSEDLKFVHVKLVSRNRKKYIVVGVFEKMYEAEEFAASFDSMSTIRPIYACNELSKKYFLNE